jgi:hypothetical protein
MPVSSGGGVFGGFFGKGWCGGSERHAQYCSVKSRKQSQKKQPKVLVFRSTRTVSSVASKPETQRK